MFEDNYYNDHAMRLKLITTARRPFEICDYRLESLIRQERQEHARTSSEYLGILYCCEVIPSGLLINDSHARLAFVSGYHMRFQLNRRGWPSMVQLTNFSNQVRPTRGFSSL